MAIISLIDTLLKGIFSAEQKFFDNPKDMYSFEASVKASTDAFAAGFLGEILSELDHAIYKCAWRDGRYAVQRKDRRTLISSVGDISFDCTYYKGIGEHNGFCHLTEELIGLERNERFTEGAEVALLCEALKTSYAEAAKVLPSKQEITKTTVMNKVHGIAEEIPDSVNPESKAVPYLYIEADEDHVSEQHGRLGDVENNQGFVSKLVYIYEYKKDSRVAGRKELVGRYYFSGLYPGTEGNSKLWTRVQTFISRNYDDEALKRVFISGDGAAWIKAGTEYVEKSVFCADKYHLMQYLNAAAAQMQEEKESVKGELWHLLYSKGPNVRRRFEGYTEVMMKTAKSPDKVDTFRKYVLGNWAAVRRTLRNDLVDGCSAESHVSHVLSDRLSSRPMGWSQTGADRMSRLRCYERNCSRGDLIKLVRYSREQRKMSATGTEGISVERISLREIMLEHYDQAKSYIERIQAHIPYSTARKIATIRTHLSDI
ncbi:MAG: ISLre2 family transposase [Lachnospiraceae bacterium]|nr:ISLre2 family transposase [Lachnospiraceae bacterium]